MDAERWQRLSPLLDALLELPEPLRSEHLAALRREDPALAECIAMLAAPALVPGCFLDDFEVAELAGRTG